MAVPFASIAPGVNVAAAVARQQQMEEGMICGMCGAEFTAGDARLECIPAAGLSARVPCVCHRQFRNLYRAKGIEVPHLREYKWSYMVCTDLFGLRDRGQNWF